ncbi:MAG TPA: 2-phosphosulfolactate phosphatase [Gemmatimonadales bacterium]|nr:2-phosphosulfolactate phosphatase [Gemmatimonadales bacterium]
MRVDVAFTPRDLDPGDVTGRTVVVIDILRFTTTACAALHAGARAVIPVASTEEALQLARTLGPADVLLGGERGGRRIEGFALGNSPREMTPAAVGGKLLVMTTTNGTPTLLATQGAEAVYLGAAVNLTALAGRLRPVVEGGGDLLVLCSGREGSFALEDAYCAGRVVEAALGGRRRWRGLNDGAIAALDLVRRYGARWERPLGTSAGGRALAAIDLAEDVAACGAADTAPVVPLFSERRIRLAPAAEAA